MVCELEVGARTLDDVCAAEKGGATRVELYSSPLEGALTPAAGLIRAAAATVSRLKLFVMIRPRAGDFLYSEREFETMRHDVDLALESGADGIMVGILKSDGRLDLRRMALLVRQCGHAPCTLHRAFDFARDPFETLEQAVDLGCQFLLTMGQDREAPIPLEARRELVARAAGRIAVQLAFGADFCTSELASVASDTGARHFHVVNGYRTRPSKMRYGGPSQTRSDYLRQTLWTVDYLSEAAVREARDALDVIQRGEPAC